MATVKIASKALKLITTAMPGKSIITMCPQQDLFEDQHTGCGVEVDSAAREHR